MDQRIVRAARILERHIGDRVDYGVVAREIGLSASRFHHLFAQEAGETPGEYLRRIRLDAAAMRLRWTRVTVGHIAESVGYASQQSFNKAFISRYGVSPTAFRGDRERWPNDPTDSVRDKDVRVIDTQGLHLLAKRYVGAPCFVPQYWGDFLAVLPKAAERPDGIFVGLLHDDMRFTPPEQVRYDCCVALEPAAAHAIVAADPRFSVVTLAAGLCASLHYQGYYAASDAPGGAQSISQAYGHLLDTWMNTSRYTFAGDSAAELYIVPPTRCPPESLDCTILVPII